jgi:hypothetical protein
MSTAALDRFVEDEDSLDPLGDDFREHTAYLDRARRVRVGPSVVVVFENARTLRLRLRDLAWLARKTTPERVDPVVRWYYSLLPRPTHVVAAVNVAAADRGLARFIGSAAIGLRIGEVSVAGLLLPDAAGDRVIGQVRWARFEFSPAARAALADEARPLTLRVEAPGYVYECPPLGPAVRAGLLADLGVVPVN